MIIRSLINLIIISFPCMLYAAEWDYFVSENCKVNTNNVVKYEPKTFYSTNNLIRDIGGNFYAQGKAFVLTGKLLDKECVPISDAVINIWHADSNGFLPNPEEIKTKNKLQDYFQATGTANTNNLGIFNFVTLLPNYALKKNGNIYLKAYIEGLGSFYRTIEINENMLINNDLQKLYPQYIDSQMSELLQYRFEWTLDVNNAFLKY